MIKVFLEVWARRACAVESVWVVPVNHFSDWEKFVDELAKENLFTIFPVGYCLMMCFPINGAIFLK
jgi:hypothetical protein